MERVQFQQEQMLAELKDLAQKGLFTQKEVKQIMKKRTAFETALVRRVPKKGDYLRYISYEITLEALRKKRAHRLNLPPGPPSVSDFALVRRQFHIFERALKKFKSDVALWIQYIHLAKKEGARSLVGRISARALQLHPNTPALYILAAEHELSHLSPSAARTLLQRGIRLNDESVEIWREYVKMELGFVESMRRRWDVLGIGIEGQGSTENRKGKQRAHGTNEEPEGGTSGDTEPMIVDDEQGTSDAARREIMRGAIVISVITNAVKALPKLELFTSIHNLLSSYPCPTHLKQSLLDHLHTLLQQTLPHVPQAIKLTATRHLTPSLQGSELIDALKDANERLSSAVKSITQKDHRDGMGKVYGEFIEDWCSKDIDDTLKLYLISSLYALIQQTKRTIAPLLTTHLDLLLRLSASSSSFSADLPPRSKVLKLAEKYTQAGEVRSHAGLWIARMGVEKMLPSRCDQDERGEGCDRWERTWREARECVRDEGTVDIWIWGLAREGEGKGGSDLDGHESGGENCEGRDGEDQVELLETLLGESLKMQDTTSSKEVHETLLTRYVSTQIRLIISSFPSDESTSSPTDTTSKIKNTTMPLTSSTSPRPPTTIPSSSLDRTLPSSFAKGDSGLGRRESGTRSQHQHREPRQQQQRNQLLSFSERVRELVQVVERSYFPSGSIWANAFSLIRTHSPSSISTQEIEVVLEEVYTRWKERDIVQSTLGMARWYLEQGRGGKCVEVLKQVKVRGTEEERQEVERVWRGVVMEFEGGRTDPSRAVRSGSDGGGDEEEMVQ